LNPCSIPETELDRQTLLPSDQSRLMFGARGLRLPAGGARLRLRGHAGPVWFDVWEGDVLGFGGYETRALTIAASVLELARRQVASVSPAGTGLARTREARTVDSRDRPGRSTSVGSLGDDLDR
jgi:hypothetical protein